MKCPACNAPIKEKDLIQRKPLDTKGFQLSAYRLVCPHCHTELAYDFQSWLLVGGGFIFYVMLGLVVLLADLPREAEILLLLVSALALSLSFFYRHRKSELRIKK